MPTRPAAVLVPLALLVAVPGARAQSPETGPAADAPAVAWVTVACPAATPVAVSDAARARRALRGTVTTDAALDPACRDALAAAGATVRVESRWLSAYSVALPDADVAARVAALPFVRAMEPVRRLAPLRASVSPTERWPLLANAALPQDMASGAFALNYGASKAQLDQIAVPAVHDQGYSGRGVVLGWLDTEYGAFTHPVFAAMVADGRLKGTRSFAPAAQSDRHGLSTASIAIGYAAGSLIGPGYGASLYAATTEYAPTETNAEEDAFVAGLEWLEAQGVDAVNVSLGYTTFDAGQRSYTYADLNGDRGITTRAADAAASRGVVVVASAGNEGCSAPSQCWYYIGTPADGDSVIAVGATTLAGAKAGFSSFGPTADGRTKPDVSAPGAGVTVASSSGGYGTSNGTSFSAPLVTGVVALLLEANPTLTPMQVRDVLRQTASQASAPDNRLGWGIVNAAAAVALARTVDVAREDAAPALRLVVAGNASASPALVLDRPATVEVVDLLGRTLRAASAVTRLDLDGLAPGVYAATATPASGGAAVRAAVVVGRR